MPLYKKKTKFEIDPTVLEKKFSVFIARSKKENIYQDIVDICNYSIMRRFEPKGSFLVFGMVFGESAELKDKADNIWNRLWISYNGAANEDQVFNFLKKSLGVMLMIEIAKDEAIWEFEPDPDKKSKLANNDTPDAAIYNIRKRR